jgi:hypothetical protein
MNAIQAERLLTPAEIAERAMNEKKALAEWPPRDHTFPGTVGMLASCTMTRAGAGKSGTGETGTCCVSLYGQDAVLTTYAAWAGGELWCIAVCDGHGISGAGVAMLCATALEEAVTTEANITDLCATLATGETLAWVDTLFSNIHERTKDLYGASGTTCSVALVIARDTEPVVLVTANAGDSPILIRTPDADAAIRQSYPKGVGASGDPVVATYLAFSPHNWDNQAEYTDYMAYCHAHGYDPCRVLVGRFNHSPGHMLVGGRGRPWPLYRPGTAEIDRESLDDFLSLVAEHYPGSIGGSQSVRRMVTLTEDGRLIPMEGHEHENWGSTGHAPGTGTIQMSRSIGDALLRRSIHLRNTPHVTVTSLTSPTHITVMSDGVGDAQWFHRVPMGSAREILDGVLGETPFPTWDDCGVACLEVVVQPVRT